MRKVGVLGVACVRVVEYSFFFSVRWVKTLGLQKFEKLAWMVDKVAWGVI